LRFTHLGQMSDFPRLGDTVALPFVDVCCSSGGTLELHKRGYGAVSGTVRHVSVPARGSYRVVVQLQEVEGCAAGPYCVELSGRCVLQEQPSKNTVKIALQAAERAGHRVLAVLGSSALAGTVLFPKAAPAYLGDDPTKLAAVYRVLQTSAFLPHPDWPSWFTGGGGWLTTPAHHSHAAAGSTASSSKRPAQPEPVAESARLAKRQALPPQLLQPGMVMHGQVGHLFLACLHTNCTAYACLPLAVHAVMH
jgi:hypothetical protein